MFKTENNMHFVNFIQGFFNLLSIHFYNVIWATLTQFLYLTLRDQNSSASRIAGDLKIYRDIVLGAEQRKVLSFCLPKYRKKYVENQGYSIQLENGRLDGGEALFKIIGPNELRISYYQRIWITNFSRRQIILL